MGGRAGHPSLCNAADTLSVAFAICSCTLALWHVLFVQVDHGSRHAGRLCATGARVQREEFLLLNDNRNVRS
jgi:hypothetical protein